MLPTGPRDGYRLHRAVRQIGLGNARPTDEIERNLSGPNWQGEILVVVHRPTGAHLRRTLVDGEADDQGGTELGRRRHPRVGAAPGGHVIEQSGTRGQFLRVVLNHGAGAEEHHAAVVHRMVEGGPGEHQSVEEGHRDTCLGAVGDQPESPVGRRAVQIELFVDACICHRGDHGRSPVVHPDVGEETFVQDR